MGVLAILGLLVLVSAAWVVVLLRERTRRVVLEKQCASVRANRDVILRLLRLAAGDQRNLALALFGQAQSVQPPDVALIGLARRLLNMSEDLIEQTDTPEGARFLEEEDILLMPVLEFAMAQVAANLGPGRRAWRLSPGLECIKLRADRRAMNQVLVNVLSGAAAATRNDDMIEFLVEASDESLALVIQDEGIGLPVPANESHKDESRGIGLRLTLARSLMQAHHGSLTVESAERIGTRVRLSFPAARVLGRAA